MNYFEQLPTIDINNQSFRNIFRRVIVNYADSDKLINYQMRDYETLTSIAYDKYGSQNYWWVIALLNNIQDINFDLPMSSEQIEYIASELATTRKYTNSIIYSGVIATDSAKTLVQFTNDEALDYQVILSIRTDTDIADIGAYGYQRVAANSFNIARSPDVGLGTFTEIEFTYVIFKMPESVDTTNTSLFSEYFDKLADESDLKRNIKILDSNSLGKFLTDFILALRDAESLLASSSSEEIEYKSEINELVEYDDTETSEHGLIVQLGEASPSGSNDFADITVDDYDFDHHVYATTKPSDGELSSIGFLAVKNNFLKPRVYNAGGADIDYAIVSPKNKNFSVDGEILESGIGTLVNDTLTITLENHDEIFLVEDICFMITPIVDDLNFLSSIGKFYYNVIDKNTVIVNRSDGDEFSLNNPRFYWSLVRSEEEYDFKSNNTIIGGGHPESDMSGAVSYFLINFRDSSGNAIDDTHIDDITITEFKYSKYDLDGSITGIVNGRYIYEVPSEDFEDYKNEMEGYSYVGAPLILPSLPNEISVKYTYGGDTLSVVLGADTAITTSNTRAFLRVDTEEEYALAMLTSWPTTPTTVDEDAMTEVLKFTATPDDLLTDVSMVGDFYFASILTCYIKKTDLPSDFLPTETTVRIFSALIDNFSFTFSSGFWSCSGDIDYIDSIPIVAGSFNASGIIQPMIWPSVSPTNYTTELPLLSEMTYTPNAAFIANGSVIVSDPEIGIISFNGQISGTTTCLFNMIPPLCFSPELLSTGIVFLTAKPYIPAVIS